MASWLSSKTLLSATSRTESFSLSSDLRLFSSSSRRCPISFTRTPNKLRIRAAGNSFGTHFRVTTSSNNRSDYVGCIVDGVPPRRLLSEVDLERELDRRRECETETCAILSGVYNGMTTGTPIKISFDTSDPIEHRGVSSLARETIARVAAGAIAKSILKDLAGTEVLAYVSQMHNVVLPTGLVDHEALTLQQIESNIVRCPDPEYAKKMINVIDKNRETGDFIGCVVTCIVKNCPCGLGSPVFDKLEAELAKAVISLPAAKGFEFGSGFAGTFLTGSQHNDEFFMGENARIRTKTNNSGGIQGGISNGEIINMRIAFMPTDNMDVTETRDTQETKKTTSDFHDTCVVPKVLPMVEAMVALVLVDQLMAHHAQCNLFPINEDVQESWN